MPILPFTEGWLVGSCQISNCHLTIPKSEYCIEMHVGRLSGDSINLLVRNTMLVLIICSRWDVSVKYLHTTIYYLWDIYMYNIYIVYIIYIYIYTVGLCVTSLQSGRLIQKQSVISIKAKRAKYAKSLVIACCMLKYWM